MRPMRVRTAYVILAMGVAIAGVMLIVIGAPSTTRGPAPAPTGGCVGVETDEVYVQYAYACSDGTRVLTFSDVTARDDYLAIALHYGVVLLTQGDRWARIKPL